MIIKRKKLVILQRLIIWIIYLLSGFILYSKKGYLSSSIVTFTRTIYPLSIFWMQIRIKKISSFLPIDPSMSTSQLWFNILPVMAALFTVIFSLTNLFLYIFNQLQSFKFIFI